MKLAKLLEELEKIDKTKSVQNGRLVKVEKEVIISHCGKLEDIKDIENGSECIWLIV